jgi:hypothetical protein
VISQWRAWQESNGSAIPITWLESLAKWLPAWLSQLLSLLLHKLFFQFRAMRHKQ